MPVTSQPGGIKIKISRPPASRETVLIRIYQQFLEKKFIPGQDRTSGRGQANG
jgi:hypothetical protein